MNYSMTTLCLCASVVQYLTTRQPHQYSITSQRRPPHITYLIPIEPPRAMHRLAVVPDHQVERPPFMRIDEAGLRRELCQIAQEHPRLRNGPTLDRTGMRGQEQRPPPRHRMASHQRLA